MKRVAKRGIDNSIVCELKANLRSLSEGSIAFPDESGLESSQIRHLFDIWFVKKLFSEMFSIFSSYMAGNGYRPTWHARKIDALYQIFMK